MILPDVRWVIGAAAAVVLAGALVVAVAMRPAPDGPAPEAAAPEAVHAVTPTAQANAFAAGGLQDPSGSQVSVDVGDPVAVRIPSLGVSSSLERLSVGRSGALGAPDDYDSAGWYADGPAPGEIGPAIIAGHVDSQTGPAVFARLDELEVGDDVVVDTDAGQSLVFTITGRMQSAKANFPTADVYRNVPRPELRLITCAGMFDRSVGHYTDNLIVFAALKGSESQ
ncbi:class F sortase [Microbacterium terricola]|uniref:Class F sortase n=1 Tax=Microbacterium terricola TaxID=344163 RepID=A0ABM8E1W2_9MICO|nr:class F sortase [Microbacterium terricola]UYK40349.1 class F sortase [Microbacterium terricola]BDV31937.1 class F sortase [Microbacterium terricola]